MWFPWDNSSELLQELVWEAGGTDIVKWIPHGPPAGGTGIMVPLTDGCGVIALCHDAHHKLHLRTALAQKAVEASLAGPSVFGNPALIHQAQQLKLLETNSDGDGPAKGEKRKADEHVETTKRKKSKKRKKRHSEEDEEKPSNKRKRHTEEDTSDN